MRIAQDRRELGPLKAVGDTIWHSSWKEFATIVEVRQIGPKSPHHTELDAMAYHVIRDNGERDARFANWFHVNAKEATV